MTTRAGVLSTSYVAWGVIIAVAALVAGKVGIAGAPSFDLRALLYGGEALKGWFATFWFVTCLVAALGIYNLMRLRFEPDSSAMLIAMAAITIVAGMIAPHSLP